jgi:hypothetical protein
MSVNLELPLKGSNTDCLGCDVLTTVKVSTVLFRVLTPCIRVCSYPRLPNPVHGSTTFLILLLISFSHQCVGDRFGLLQ